MRKLGSFSGKLKIELKFVLNTKKQNKYYARLNQLLINLINVLK